MYFKETEDFYTTLTKWQKIEAKQNPASGSGVTFGCQYEDRHVFVMIY